jgi:hypothetical protein
MVLKSKEASQIDVLTNNFLAKKAPKAAREADFQNRGRAFARPSTGNSLITKNARRRGAKFRQNWK